MADFPTTIKNLNTLLGTQLLDGGGGGGGSWTVLTEETVTTTAGAGGNSVQLIYSFGQNPPEKLRITFDGTSYECSRMLVNNEGYAYGGVDPTTPSPDFSEYPFVLVAVSPTATLLNTEIAGTYTIKIEAPQSGGSSETIS